MAEPYLSELQSVVTRSVSSDVSVVCKHFFAGAAAYADGAIFSTLTPVGLAFKLAKSVREPLLEANGAPLRYFPNAPIKREYVLFTDPELLDDRQLKLLMSQSMSHVINGDL